MSQEAFQGYRLSPQQRHLLLLQRDTPRAVFWSRCAVRVTGPIDHERLERAIKSVVEQHEILRTTFALLPGMTLPAQVIQEDSPDCVKCSDVTSLNTEEQNSLLLKLFDTSDDSAYDRLPLFRCDLLRLSADETVLLFKAPVVCADLRSLEMIVSQIATHYELESRTLDVMQYADFAEWHHALLEAEDGEQGRRYWNSQTLQADVKIAFSNSSAQETFAPEVLRLELSSPSTSDLTRVALACWQILIQRLNTPSNVTIARAIDGRRHPELEHSVGLYNRYVPLPVIVDEEMSTDDLLKTVAAAEEEAIQWQEYFGWRTGEGPERYFPVCFEERRGPIAFRAGDVTFSIYRAEATDDRFELKLVTVLDGAVPHLELHYDASRYVREDVRRLGAELTTLIAGFIGNHGGAVSDLHSLNSEACLRIVKGFNPTSQDLPVSCIHELFEAQVEKTPDVPAVVCDSAQVTYVQLNRRANRLARYLQKLNVGPDVPVGLCLERSVDFVIGMLAILKAGGAYLPLAVNTPAARLETMMSEAGANLLLTDSERMISGVRVLPLNRLRDEIAKEKSGNIVNNVTPANLAYVIFTSGSTGKPKGVAVEHRQLCNYIHAIDYKVRLSACRSFAIVSTLVADLAHTMFFPSLVSGGVLHPIPEDEAASPELLADYFSRNPIDCLKIVPAHLSALLTASRAVDILPRRHLLLGGEAASQRLLDQIRELSPELTVWNHYGPTETTVGCVAQQMVPETSEAPAIGTPLSNNTVYILDQRLRPVSIGVAGELYVGGAQVSRGYVNRPDLTAEAFVPDPFSEIAGCRLYRTGDLARYHTDGRIQLLGRVDHQIKVRGYRIEPEEIQLVLNRHPQIRQSVIVAPADRRGERQLIAYVIPKGGVTPAVEDLQAFLREHLPDYMVPWKFVFLAALPLTANGKIDRQALPVPDVVEKQYVAPRNSIEQELSRIWSTVLAIPEPGIHENFFALGGDSILAIQVVARANQAGMNLVTRQIFQHQTIAELAAVALDGMRPREDQGLVTGEVPLTAVQARFFELELRDPHHYNQAKLLMLRQPIDAVCLQRAVEFLLRHHDALRLRFFRSEAAWKQISSEHESSPVFEHVEFDEAKVAEVLAREADRLHAALNLQAGPIIRVALFDGADKSAGYLLIVVHHLAVDAVSWGVLLEDLETAYRQLAAGEQVSLPSKTTSFKRWAEELTQVARSPAIAAEIDYWTSCLSQTVASLPVDHAGQNTVASRRTVSVSLTAKETSEILLDLPAKYRTHIDEMLLAAITSTFTAWMKTSSLLIDLEQHGREYLVEGMDLTRTVGWFTTIFPVMFDIGNSATPLDVLRAVKERLRAIPNHGIGYGMLRYLSGRTEVIDEFARMPQAEVRFNYLGHLDRTLASSNLFGAAQYASGQAQSPRQERGYLLNIISGVTNGELHLHWTYSANIHAINTIESLAETCLAQLRALLSDGQTADAVYAPADFPKAGLSQSDLNTILAKLRS